MRPDSLAIDPAQCGVSSAQNFSGTFDQIDDVDFINLFASGSEITV
jgi:hypothetical protein